MIDPLVSQIRRHRARFTLWQESDDASITRRLAQIGVLGWMIIVPMLGGVFLGRWLDHKFATGVLFTAPLLLLGAAMGNWSAWRWMQSS